MRTQPINDSILRNKSARVRKTFSDQEFSNVFRPSFRKAFVTGKPTSRLVITAALFVTVASIGAAAETVSPVSIRITNPRAGRLQLVTGAVNAPGRPVILVKPDIPNEPWWIHGQAVPVGPKGFSAKAIFGSAVTLPSTKFRVVSILVDPSKERYVTGQAIKELPDVPMSDQLLITLVKNGTPPRGIIRAGSDEPEEQPHLAEITSPGNGSEVKRVTEIKGRIQAPYQPVVLVRPLADGSVWYVQKAPKLNDDGEFSLDVVFGNKQTKQGQRFRVIVLAPPTKESAAKLKLGTIIRKLPIGEGVSKEAVVTLREKSSRQPPELEATTAETRTLR
jgi:hypothetical protein